MNDKYQELVTETVKLLTANHNLILTGAPGTGKTHLAKEIAKTMLGLNIINDLKSCSRFGFVQFHPSYDYTDFVEGLRPISEASSKSKKKEKKESIGFGLVSGIFKNFCSEALNTICKKKKDYIFATKSEDDILKDAWNELIGQLNNNPAFISNRYQYIVTENSIKWKKNGYDKESKDTEWTLEKLKKILTLEEISEKSISNAIGKDVGSDWNGGKEIREELLKRQQAKKDEQEKILNEIQQNKENTYVFVIDEINRGEISKIFGELFYSLDPGYRGQDGAVQTQYANMQTEKSEFDKILKNGKTGQFFIPENVYIIGTMNDIDRSVESMDFAMRRRFAFYEVKAEDTQDTILECLGEDDQKEAISRMNKLNKKICKDGGFSEAYQIGAAYFKKVELFKEKEKEKWEKLWKYYLEGTLREYLRGRDDEEDILLKWKEAYDSEQNDSNF